MLILLLAGLLASPLQAEEALSLSALQAQVRAANPALQAMRREAEMVQAEARVLGAWPDPMLSYEWMQLRWPDPSLADAMGRRLELQQILPFPGKAGAKEKAGQHLARRAQAKVFSEEAMLVFEASEAYWMQQKARLNAKAQTQAQAVMEGFRKILSRRGRLGRLDRMGQLMESMLERDLGNSEAMGLMWQAEERTLQFKLKRLLGKDPAASLPALAEADAAALLVPAWSAQELWSKAQDRNPELQDAQHHLNHALAEQSAMRREWLPDLMIEGGYVESAGPSEASLKLGLSLPWLWVWAQNGRTSAAAAQVLEAQALAQDRRLKSREEAGRLANELKAAQAQLKLSLERILPAAEKALNAAEAGFSSGEIEGRDAMDAVMGFMQASEDYAGRLAQVGTTLAAIDRLMAAPVLEKSHD